MEREGALHQQSREGRYANSEWKDVTPTIVQDGVVKDKQWTETEGRKRGVNDNAFILILITSERS